MTVDELVKLIDKKVLYEIIQYCELNDDSANDFINNTLKNKIIIEKYGDKPPMFNDNIIKNKTPDDVIKIDVVINNKETVGTEIIDEPSSKKRKLKTK